LRRGASPPWTPLFSGRRPLLRSVRRPRGDSQLVRLRFASPGCYSPLDPPVLQSSATPTECPTTQGGFAARPAPLRFAGLLLPPGPPCSPVVGHSYGVSDDPGGIRSSSGSASLRRAATPPWTPLFSSRRPLLRSVRRPRGDSQLVRLRFASPGCYSPLDPPGGRPPPPGGAPRRTPFAGRSKPRPPWAQPGSPGPPSTFPPRL